MNKKTPISLKLLILIFSLFPFTIKGQSVEPDTLSLQNLTSVEEPSDSTTNEEVIKEDNNARFKFRLSTDGTYTSGNVNRALIQLASGIDWNLSQLLKLSSSPSFIYGQQNKQLNEREIFTDLRTTFLYDKPIYYLAFTSFERSNLRKINERFIGGAGVGIKLLQKPNVYLSVTNVLLYEKTDFLLNNDFPDRDLLRNSTRILGEYTLASGKMIISHTLFIQPGLTQKNFRWNGNLVFRYQITKRTGIRSTMENSYESVVVSGRKNNDFRWTFGVVFEFKK